MRFIQREAGDDGRRTDQTTDAGQNPQMYQALKDQGSLDEVVEGLLDEALSLVRKRGGRSEAQQRRRHHWKQLQEVKMAQMEALEVAWAQIEEQITA
ncbi:MAG: hypothetical protein R3F37_13255 [Candidatus Competibacteraceae bacterium]